MQKLTPTASYLIALEKIEKLVWKIYKKTQGVDTAIFSILRDIILYKRKKRQSPPNKLL